MDEKEKMPRRLTMGTFLVLAVFLVTGNAPVAAEQVPEWQALLEKIVNINSGTRNFEGLEANRKALVPEFETLGFEVTTHDLKDGHKLVSMVVPDARPEVLLMGHIDTVFKKDSALQKFEVRGDRIYGPGVIDMKAGIVLMLDLMRTFKKSGQLGKFMVIINDDEEIGSPYSKDLVKKLVAGIKTGLIFEPGLPDSAVVTSHAGVYWLTVSVEGKAAHAGLEPEKGINACLGLSEKVVRISRLSDYARKLSVNVGVIKGGTKPNVVCEHAEAGIDIRFVAKNDLETTLAAIRAIADKSYVYNDLLKAGTTASLKTLVSKSSMPASRTARLFGLLEVAGKKVDQEVRGRHVGYTSDANDLADTGMDLLVGLGPYGAGMHTDVEYLTISTFDQRRELTEALIREILK